MNMTKTNHIIAFILITIFLASCKTQKAIKRIYGNVKSIESLTYTYNNDEERFFSHSKVIFDQQGKPVEQNKFNTSDGSLDSKRIAVYDKNGNVESDRYKGDVKPENPSYIYDQNGNFSKIIYDSENEKSEVIFEYDQQQNIIGRSVYTEEIIEEKAVWEYDKNRNKTKRDLYRYSPNGDLDAKLTLQYEYDRKGRIIANYRFANDTITYKSLFEYKKKGKEKIAFVYLHGEDFSYREATIYNKKNDIIAEKKYHQSGKLNYQITYTYKYDIKGNWIEKKRFYNERLAELSKRNIEYYEK